MFLFLTFKGFPSYVACLLFYINGNQLSRFKGKKTKVFSVVLHYIQPFGENPYIVDKFKLNFNIVNKIVFSGFNFKTIFIVVVFMACFVFLILCLELTM